MILPITRNQETAVPFPYKSGDSYIRARAIDDFGVGTRHCRFLPLTPIVTFEPGRSMILG
ncbi:hypothetical protein [Microcoleus sp. BROC3]|uniref:hypothetical protein n=1 Tax=Microcoleus sp. BROC3 TaxID=3055323 RepID=UPI002FD433A0